MICAGLPEGGKDSCQVRRRLEFTFYYLLNIQGDSGGPLYLVDSAMKHKQIGITSFGSGLGCEIGWHAGFTRLKPNEKS